MAPTRHASDRGVIVLLFLMVFGSGCEMLLISPVLPQMAADLGVTISQAGHWVTAYAAAAGIAAFVFGPISDRVGRRKVLLWGTATLGMGTVACGLSGDYWTLMFARTISGAGSGMLVTSTTPFVGDHFPAETRARAMGYVINGFFLALVLGVPLGATLADNLGWQLMFFSLGGFLVFLFVISWLFLPAPRYADKTHAPENFASGIVAYVKLLTHRQVWGTIQLSCVVGCAMTMYSVYLSPWLAHVFQFESTQRGLVYALGAPATFFAPPAASWLADRFGRRPVVIAACIYVAFVMALMPMSVEYGQLFHSHFPGPDFQIAGNPIVLLAPLFLLAFALFFGGNFRSGPFHTYAVELVPASERGSLAALRNFANQLGSAVGAATGALIWSGNSESFFVICAIGSGLNLLSGILFWALTRGKLKLS